MRTTTSTRVLLCVALIAFWLGGSSAAADRSADNQELQRIKREMREKKNELKRADRKERSILSELETIDRGIQTGSAQLTDQQKRLRDSEAALQEVEQNNAVLNRELTALKQYYSQRLRALYKLKQGRVCCCNTFSGRVGPDAEAGQVSRYDSRPGPGDHEGVRQCPDETCGAAGGNR